MSFLGIDVGTSAVKAQVFDGEGFCIFSACEEYTMVYPRPGWVEHDPERIWRNFCRVIQCVAQNTRHDPVQSISLSVLGDCLTPVDRQGQPLANSIICFDVRGDQYHHWLVSQCGQQTIFRITGMAPQPGFGINYILWWKHERPDLYKKTWKFLYYEDFLLFRLGARPVIDYSLASRTQVFDVEQKAWSETLLNYCDIEPERFAEPVPSGVVVGTLSKDMARYLGLSAEVKLVSGGMDQAVCAFGGGVEEGIAVNSAGTVEALTVCLKNPMRSDAMLSHNFSSNCHIIPGEYLLFAYNYSGGGLLRWYNDTFGIKEQQSAEWLGRCSYDLIIESASDNPSPVMVLPYFHGSGTPFFDPQAKGMIVGLTLNTLPTDIIKAILEAVPFEMKLNLDLMEQSGIRINEINCIGGCSKSNKWLQIKADILGKTMNRLNCLEAGCLGAAVLGMYACGKVKSLKDTVDTMISINFSMNPNPFIQKQYEHRFDLYKNLYPTVKHILHQV